jgi:uncharacterized protein (DUF58 family)
VTKLSKTRWPLFRFLGKLLLHDFVVPTRRLISLISLGSIVIILGYLFELGMYAFWAYNCLLLIFSLIDILLLPRRREWSIERLLPERVDVRQKFEVQLRLTTRQPHIVRIELVDDLPSSFKTRQQNDTTISRKIEKSASTASTEVTPTDQVPIATTATQAIPGSTTTAQKEPSTATTVTQTIPVSTTTAQKEPLTAPPTTTTGMFQGTSGTFSYPTRAEERGRFTFSNVFLRYYGGLGLWKKQVLIKLPQEIRVYPDLSAVRGVLGSLQNALILDGNRIYRKQRSGSDFHYVREYTEGDEPRHMNWKASARTAKLMTNEYRPEKGKVVTLLLDCGRMMGIELDGQVKLDRCLEAALALASVALKQGDQVSLLAFSNQVKVYVPPGKGITHLHALTEAVFDLKHDFVEPSYSAALIYLQRMLKKRSFIVLFSDMESYLYDSGLLPYMQRIRRGNPTLLLSLGDPLLHDWARIQAENSHQAYVQSIAHKFTMDRKRYIHSMTGQGIPVLEVPADQLTLSAVNAYLELKSRDAL